MYDVALDLREKKYFEKETLIMATQNCSESSTEDMNAFPFLLKSVFQKFYFWREASSDKAWALEKMKDVLIKELGKNPHLLTREDCVLFMNCFFDENDNLLHYPDFVMIEVSRMITGIMMSSPVTEDQDFIVMFKLLRGVVSHGQLDKGQRVSVMFECMHRLLLNGTARVIDQMMCYEFDAAFALLFAVAGTQNYTRLSASTYLIELIKFAYNDELETINVEKAWSKENRSSLKDKLSRLFSTFNSNLMQSSQISTSRSCLDIVANYCRLLTLCVENCSEWGFAFAFSGGAVDCTYHIWCKLLQTLNSHKHSDAGDIAVSSIEQLAVIANKRSNTKDRDAAFGTLSSLILTNFADPNSSVNVSDIVVMAYSVVSRWCDGVLNSPDSVSQRALLDLSILPLLVVLDVHHLHSNAEISLLINQAKKELEGKSAAKYSCRIRGAMSNAFSLADNNRLVDASSFASILKYVTFKTGDHPSNVSQPLLNYRMVPSKQALACLLHGFNLFKDDIENLSRGFKACEADNIQTYVAPVINFRGISHQDLAMTLDCYETLLNTTERSGTHVRRECIRSVLEGLELHLVNVDPNLREVAVRGVGQLCLLDNAIVQEEVAALRSLPSLWKCVKDKEENVVTQVFKVILQIAKYGTVERLKDTLSRMETNEGELKVELQNCLLSSQWDLIKPVAFSLLSSLSDPPNVIRYAEVCIHQSNSLATPAVFSYIDGLFKRCTDICTKDDLKRKIDRLCYLLLEGWGDLILAVVNGENTTCLRYAVDILMSVNEFLTRDDIAELEKMDELVHADEVGGLVDQVTLLKSKMPPYAKQVLKGSTFLDLAGEIIQQANEANITGQCQDTMDKEKSMNMDKEGVGQNGAEEVGVVDHLDTTTERQPLALSEKPFLLPEMVYSVVETCTNKSQSTLHFFMLAGFRELLNLLPLTSLRTEAHRSTDEYERNSDAILFDINHVIDSSFNSRTKQIEKEAIEIFLTEHLQILENMINNEVVNDSNFLNTLIELQSRVNNFIQLKESFCKFVLSKRKTAFCRKLDVETLEFSSDFFNNGLVFVTNEFRKGISTKDFFSSCEGMKLLMDMYFSCDTRKRAVSFDDKSNCDEFLKVKVSKAEIGSNDNSRLSLTQTSNDGKTETELSHFIEEIKNAVELVKKSKRSERVCLILDVVIKVISKCFQMINAGQKNVPTLTSMRATLDQLKEWYCEDEMDGFDSDGDNDPTLIDCY